METARGLICTRGIGRVVDKSKGNGYNKKTEGRCIWRLTLVGRQNYVDRSGASRAVNTLSWS